MTETQSYLSLKLGQAPKTGERSTGHIKYRILTDPNRQRLYLTITGNDGGGWFSPEVVPLSRIEELFDALPDRSQALPSKALRGAFISKSVNNAGFLAALLRAEGLLAPAPEAAHQHVLTEDWSLWKSVMLSEPGEPYDPISKGNTGKATPPINILAKDLEKKPKGKRKGAKLDTAEVPTVSDANTAIDSADLSDTYAAKDDVP